MKDIIRQAVADAAEWLYQNRGVATEHWLAEKMPEAILSVCTAAQEFDAEERRKDQLRAWDEAHSVDVVILSHPAFKDDIVEVRSRMHERDASAKRTEQLADFVAKPRIDNVLITGPGGFVAHGAGVVGRTVMVDPRPTATVRDVWQMQFIGRGERRAEVADHALAIWLRDGCGAWFLRNAEPNDILKLSLEKSGRDFSKDVELPAPTDPIWSIAVTASFDGAEGEGRVWLSAKDDDESMIAIEGRENASTLASMLIDWVRPDVVVVQRALLERLAKIENIPNNEDQGPGYDACPDCGRCGNWQWKAGKVISKAPIEHDHDCALSELRKLL